MKPTKDNLIILLEEMIEKLKPFKGITEFGENYYNIDGFVDDLRSDIFGLKDGDSNYEDQDDEEEEEELKNNYLRNK